MGATRKVRSTPDEVRNSVEMLQSDGVCGRHLFGVNKLERRREKVFTLTRAGWKFLGEYRDHESAADTRPVKNIVQVVLMERLGDVLKAAGVNDHIKVFPKGFGSANIHALKREAGFA